MLRSRLIVRVEVPGDVIVQAGQHLECGKHFSVAVHRTQRMRHRTGGVGDDERIPGVSLGLSGVQVGGFSHRQAGQVGDRAVAGPRHGDRQGADSVGLVDDQQYTAMGLELGEHLNEVGFVLGQALS